MRYADFYECDICNGNQVGVSLFVQGCPFHCKGCFNQETWDFNGGKEWTPQAEKRFFDLIDRDYIHRVSFLGGEPLCIENHVEIGKLIKKIRQLYQNKEIWVYTGDTFENIKADSGRDEILQYIDVLVDGSFDYDKRDLSLAFRGSTNQRIIDVQNSLKTGEIVLWHSQQI